MPDVRRSYSICSGKMAFGNNVNMSGAMGRIRASWQPFVDQGVRIEGQSKLLERGARGGKAHNHIYTEHTPTPFLIISTTKVVRSVNHSTANYQSLTSDLIITMQFTKATIIAFAALLSTSFAAPSGSCADKATSCRSSGGTNCDQDAKACCDQIQVVSPKSDGDHYQCYQDSGIGNLLQSKRDVGDDCASKAKACRSSGGANCDDQAQTCCDQIQVVSPKSDGDHYQCYQDAGIGSRLSKRDVGDDCAASAKTCRSSGGANCDQQAKTCCDQIQVVSPKSDGDHYQCYQNSGIGSMLSQ